jgi:hypothetical protein
MIVDDSAGACPRTYLALSSFQRRSCAADKVNARSCRTVIRIDETVEERVVGGALNEAFGAQPYDHGRILPPFRALTARASASRAQRQPRDLSHDGSGTGMEGDPQSANPD